MLRSPREGRDGADNQVAFGLGDELVQRFPNLWEFVSAAAFEDGAARQTGTVLLFTEAGRAKACLNDRECGEVAFVTGDTLSALLVNVEEGLAAEDLDWRPSRAKGGGKR